LSIFLSKKLFLMELLRAGGWLHVGIINLVFPPTCLFCRQPLLAREVDDFLCFSCNSKTPFIASGGCSLCAGPPGKCMCLSRGGLSFSFSGTAALGGYGGELKACLHRFKYTGSSHLAKPLGQLLARRVREQKNWPPFDAIVPIPLHSTRLRERGYNQSLLLARQMATSLEIPVADLLERRIQTPSQTKLTRHERLHNVKGAFGIKPPPPPLSFPFSLFLSRPTPPFCPPFTAKNFLLVDDIFTTGSTLEEAASLLLSQGAASVYNAVAAR
jgi:competence protein ComFC